MTSLAASHLSSPFFPTHRTVYILGKWIYFLHISPKYAIFCLLMVVTDPQRVYHVPDPHLSALHMLTHLILTIILFGRYYYDPHFRDEEPEACCLRSKDEYAAKPGYEVTNPVFLPIQQASPGLFTDSGKFPRESDGTKV